MIETPRTPRAVIDEAIRSNRAALRLYLALTVVAAVVGIGALVVGIIRECGPSAIAGGAVSLLVWPAIDRLDRVWRINVALRLLELPLTSSRTAEAAGDAILRIYEHVIRGNAR